MITYMGGILSTIERVFGLKSEYSAYVMSGNEISQFLLIFFVPCINQVKRRPLWIGNGMAKFQILSFYNSYCYDFRCRNFYQNLSRNLFLFLYRTFLSRKVFMILCHVYGLSFKTIRDIQMEDLVRKF